MSDSFTFAQAPKAQSDHKESRLVGNIITEIGKNDNPAIWRGCRANELPALEDASQPLPEATEDISGQVARGFSWRLAWARLSRYDRARSGSRRDLRCWCSARTRFWCCFWG